MTTEKALSEALTSSTPAAATALWPAVGEGAVMQPPGVDEFKKEKKTLLPREPSFYKRIYPTCIYLFIFSGGGFWTPCSPQSVKNIHIWTILFIFLSSFNDSFL